MPQPRKKAVGALFCAKYYSPRRASGGKHDRYSKNRKDAPAWLAPHRGVADPNRKIKAGTIIIHSLAEKRKKKIKRKKIISMLLAMVMFFGMVDCGARNETAAPVAETKAPLTQGSL